LKGAAASRKNAGRIPILNFGGKSTELWCPGGESAFISQMVAESVECSKKVFWFSTLVSKETHLPKVYSAIEIAKAVDYKMIDLTQGQKKSRIVAWTFLDPKQQEEWPLRRWKNPPL